MARQDSKDETAKQDSAKNKPGKSYGKDNALYWHKRVYRPTYVIDGEKKESPHYFVRIRYKDAGPDGERIERRFNLSLGTSEIGVAAKMAKDVYQSLRTKGWEATLARYRPKRKAKSIVTIGEFLDRVKKTAGIKPKTFAGYSAKLRTIVSEIFGIEPPVVEDADQRYAPQGKGKHHEWIEAIEAVKLSNLTPEKVQAWKVKRINAARDEGPAKERAARTTVNSLMANAKALFAPKHLEFVGELGLPFKDPFDGVRREKEPSVRYQGKIDLGDLTQDAIRELGPEELKFFVLAGLAGLRRGEIEALTWDAFNWKAGTVCVETTEHFSTKSEDARREVDLDPELIALLRGFKAKATGRFVIESDFDPKPGATYTYYRAKEVAKRLIKWLRKKGIRSQKPIHELRKELGSVITAKYGLFPASKVLGHANPGITAKYYADKKGRTTVGLGQLLRGAENVVEMPGMAENQPAPKTQVS